MTNRTNKLVCFNRYPVLIVVGLLVLTASGPAVGGNRIRDIARPLGEITNKLVGQGVVTGLDGTGDGGDALIKARALMTGLQNLGSPPGAIEELKNAKNVAIVWVTAELPRYGIRSGGKIDVTVSSIYNAKSLAGGVLMMTPMISYHLSDERVYAWAQGPVSIPGSDHNTSGVVKGGAVMEEDLLYDFIDYDVDGNAFFDLILDDKHSGFRAADAIALLINEETSPPEVDQQANYLDSDTSIRRIAKAYSPETIRVNIPDKQAHDPISFIGRVMDFPVGDFPDPEATVSINERNGTIAITGNVEIAPGILHVNGLAIRIVEPKPQPQPGMPVISQTEWARFNPASESVTTLDDLTATLDQLNVPVQQKIYAIYALHSSGLLRARIITE